MPARALAALAAAMAVLAIWSAVHGDPARGRQQSPPGPPDVVFLLLDEFPIDALRTPAGGIDGARYPNFARLAATSTWYRNAWTVYDSTFKAVPAILDARLPKPHTQPDVRSHPRNLFTLFAERGWRLVDDEAGTALCPRRYCPRAPPTRPAILPQIGGTLRPRRFRRWVDSMRPLRRPTLWFQHALFPHVPWVYLPSGRRIRPSWRDPVRGLSSPAGFHDEALTANNQQRFLLQLGFTDRLLGTLLDQLKRRGMLDNTLLVLMADHGYSFRVGAKDRRRVDERNVHEIAPIPLFIMAPGQRVGRVDRAYVRSIDVVPTVADMLGLRLDWPHDGRPASARITRRRRLVRLPTRPFDRIIRIRAAALERRRRANIAHRERLFRTGFESVLLYGDAYAGAFHVGPRPDLVGRAVASLRARPAGAVRARLADAVPLRSVRASSGLWPVQIAGRIQGGGPRARRTVAVALDGRIAATARSFYLDGDPLETFSVLVAPGTLREGSNRARVFQVRGTGAGTTITPLGGS